MQDRWFMEVENGLIYNSPKGYTMIKSCWWMKTNSVTERDTAFTKPCSCDIESVKACGPLSFYTAKASMSYVEGAGWIIGDD